jgi:cyclopropane-fatty-acyl-phospholipid synthase
LIASHIGNTTEETKLETPANRDPGASPDAIQRHYDVGYDFYRLWLDTSLTYSCALWEPNDTLESAQQRKLDYHIGQARAAGADHVLDVGCGWGSALRRLVDGHGVRKATGLSLSRDQVQRIKALDDRRIEARLESWCDHEPARPYDAIISMGAFEHFVKPHLPRAEKIEAYRMFFERCHEWLKTDGWFSLQTLAYENKSEDVPGQFSENVILPESDAPRLAEIARAGEGLFEVVGLRNDREQYERTCREWLSRLKANRGKALDLVGSAVIARYETFLKLAIVGFHTGMISLLRITLRRVPARQS